MTAKNLSHVRNKSSSLETLTKTGHSVDTIRAVVFDLPTMFFLTVSKSSVFSLNWISRSLNTGCGATDNKDKRDQSAKSKERGRGNAFEQISHRFVLDDFFLLVSFFFEFADTLLNRSTDKNSLCFPPIPH